MANLTIRNLDDNIKTRLRVAAAQHGCSMEEEVRNILRHALAETSVQTGLGSRIHQRFAAHFGTPDESDVLSIPQRTEPARVVDFES